MVKAYFENFTHSYPEPGQVLTAINTEVTRVLKNTGFYFSALYIVIDLDSLTLACANAGHLPLLCVTHEHGKKKLHRIGETSAGTIIGSFEDVNYESERFELVKGSKLLLVTDGIVEARDKNNRDQFFGMERLAEFLLGHADEKAQICIEHLIGEIDEYAGDQAAADDRTVICISILENKQQAQGEDEKNAPLIDEAYKKGRGFLKQKKYREAAQEFNKLIKMEKNPFGAYSYLGQILSIAGRFEEAKRYFLKSLALNPEYHQVYYYLGIVLYNLKEIEEAKKYWLLLKEKAGDFKNVNEYLSKLDNIQ
jgi:tetratricopeptide (TPR) repeat protein